jgi:hypothetical protein
MKYIYKVKFYIAVAFGIVSLTGCTVEDEYDPGVPKPAGAPYTTTTNTRIVNASPGAKAGPTDSPVVQFAFNNILQLTNQNQPQSEANLPVELNYLQSTPYRGIRASAAAQVRYFNKANGNSLGSLTANYLQGTSYTTFLIDSVTRPGGLRVIQFSDNLASPPGGQAKVRFIHVAPNAPRIVVTNPGNDDVVVFSARTYAQTGTAIQNFTNLTAGTYNLDVRNDAADGKPVILPLTDVLFEAGKIYTVYARGLVGGAGGQELGATIIVHN